VVNVLGDSFGAAIVEHYSKNDLKPLSGDLNVNRNGNSVAVFDIDDNANGIKGVDNRVYADERM
jgi:hypothetical protein